MREIWNVRLEDGSHYNVVYDKNMISINQGPPEKIRKFKVEKASMLETAYQIPLGNRMALLYLAGGSCVLTMDGIDCRNGKPYEMLKMPWWAWIFAILYAINFLVIMGGAIGGAISGGFAFASSTIAANPKKKTLHKVFACLGLYLAVTAVTVLFVLGATILLQPN